jgi:hypothetical protein
MTKTQLIEDIRRDVPFPQLLAAMLYIKCIQDIKDKGGEVSGISPTWMLDEFLPGCTADQLELLREIAVAIGLEDDALQ